MKTRLLVFGLVLGLLMFHQPSRVYAVSMLGVDRITFTDSMGHDTGDVVSLQGLGGGAVDSKNPKVILAKSLVPGRGTVIAIENNYDANGELTNDQESGYVLMVDGQLHKSAKAAYFEMAFNWRPNKQGYYVVGAMVEGGAQQYDIKIPYGNTAIWLRKNGVVQVQGAWHALDDIGNVMVEVGPAGLKLRNNGTLRQVSIGEPDSGGPGKRALVVDN